MIQPHQILLLLISEGIGLSSDDGSLVLHIPRTPGPGAAVLLGKVADCSQALAALVSCGATIPHGIASKSDRAFLEGDEGERKKRLEHAFGFTQKMGFPAYGFDK